MKNLKKIWELISYWMLWAFIIILIGWVILFLIEVSMWLFSYKSPWLCWLFVLWVIWFILWLVAYLDNDNK